MRAFDDWNFTDNEPGGGGTRVHQWYGGGTHFEDGLRHPYDLINTPEERTVYVNIFNDGAILTPHATEETAIAVSERCPNTRYDAIAVPVTYTVGYGVSDE